MNASSPAIIKCCTRCGVEKPLSEFASMAASKEGRAWNCRACASEKYAAWRAANKEKLKINKAAYHALNREKISARHAEWRAANEDSIKSRGAAYRELNRETAKANSVLWRAENTEQSRAAVKAWRAANPEKAKAIVIAFLTANPGIKRIYDNNREARKRTSGGTLSKGLVEMLFKLQQGKCPCCGQSLGGDYHLDHKMPIALGGVNEDWNMQLLRKQCNLNKNKKHPVEFMQSRGFLL